MTIEESIAKALETRLKNRFYAEKGNVSLDFIEDSVMRVIEELRQTEVPQALIDQAPDLTVKEQKYLGPTTSAAVQKSRQALYEILSEVISDPEFDPDGYLSAMTYWYEFQQLARAYGKKLLYVTARKKEEK